MEYIPIIGCLCLGMFVGWLIGFFLFRMKQFTAQALTSVISITFGAVIIKFLGPDKTVWWFYPIGLVVGKVLHAIIAKLCGAPSEGIAYGKIFRPGRIKTGTEKNSEKKGKNSV